MHNLYLYSLQLLRINQAVSQIALCSRNQVLVFNLHSIFTCNFGFGRDNA